MLSPLHGFLEREGFGVYAVTSVTNSGLAVDVNSSNQSFSSSPYGATYGSVSLYSGTTASNNSRELGWLLQPVTASGPSLLNILTQVYDESVAAGQTAVIIMSKAGAFIGTDQYATGSTTGHFALDGTSAPGTICGISAGQPRLLQSGDYPRLKLLGKVVQRSLSLAAFEIL